MKKKLLGAALGAAMVCSLAGCGLKEPETTTAAPETTAAAAEEAGADAEAAEEAEDTDAAAEEGAEAASGEVNADAADDPAVTLVYAEVNPLDTVVGQTATAFKEKVEELSGGSITIDLQASGVLGAEGDVLDTMLGGGGTIDIARISAASLTAYGTAKSNLLTIPYTFTDREHYWAFANSDLAEEFLMEPEDLGLGVRGLFYAEEGFRHFFTVDPVSSIEDLAGMKLRVPNDPIMVATVEALGANPTFVAFTELYSSLQTGVVDGAEQPITNYQSNAFQEVAPNLILDGHQMGAVQVIITDDAWNNKLTEAQRECVLEASQYASDFNAQIAEDNENAVLDELRAAGVNVVDVEDKTPWQEACADVIAEYSADNADLYQAILDLAQ